MRKISNASGPSYFYSQWLNQDEIRENIYFNDAHLQLIRLFRPLIRHVSQIPNEMRQICKLLILRQIKVFSIAFFKFLSKLRKELKIWIIFQWIIASITSGDFWWEVETDSNIKIFTENDASFLVIMLKHHAGVFASHLMKGLDLTMLDVAIAM